MSRISRIVFFIRPIRATCPEPVEGFVAKCDPFGPPGGLSCEVPVFLRGKVPVFFWGAWRLYLSSYWQRNFFPLTSGNLDNGAGIIFFPLALTNGDGFDTTICLGA